MENNTQFPEFEKRLENEHPVPYHEDIGLRYDLPLGSILALIGFIPLLLPNFSMGIVQIIGLAACLLGILLIIRGLVLYRILLKQYSFRGLTRQTMSDTIMYLDAQLVQPEEFEALAPYHGKSPLSSYMLSLKKEEFTKFLISTAGLVTWPSMIIEKHETTIRTKKRSLYYTLVLLIVCILLLAMTVWYLVSTGDWQILIWIQLPLFFLFQILHFAFTHFFYLKYYYNSGWITKVMKSDSIRLEEILDQIFKLLQSKFPYPLRFHLVREYPQLKYTGRTKTSFTLIKLKEAVLYPTITS